MAQKVRVTILLFRIENGNPEVLIGKTGKWLIDYYDRGHRKDTDPTNPFKNKALKSEDQRVYKGNPRSFGDSLIGQHEVLNQFVGPNNVSAARRVLENRIHLIQRYFNDQTKDIRVTTIVEKNDYYTGKLVLPHQGFNFLGGEQNNGEDDMATAIREFTEETGSNLTIANPQPLRGRDHIIVGMYATSADGNAVLTSWRNLRDNSGSELVDLKWRAVNNLTNLVGSALDQKTVNDALAQAQGAQAQGQGGNTSTASSQSSSYVPQALVALQSTMPPQVCNGGAGCPPGPQVLATTRLPQQTGPSSSTTTSSSNSRPLGVFTPQGPAPTMWSQTQTGPSSSTTTSASAPTVFTPQKKPGGKRRRSTRRKPIRALRKTRKSRGSVLHY